MPDITLVTYATPHLRHRQLALGISARATGGIGKVENWNTRRLTAEGFGTECPEVSIKERGAGFWAWKPFVISRALREASEGDLILYCDVGRSFEWKRIHRPLDRLVDWADARGQDIFPGVKIGFHGQLSKWTKRYAFVATGTDAPEFHTAAPIQASFCLWRKTANSVAMVEEWFELCKQRKLVSDDVVEGSENLPEFTEHRHDQSLWSLLCLKHGLQAYDPSVGGEAPDYDEKNPAEIAKVMGEPAPSRREPFWFRAGLPLAEKLEKLVR